jgi:SAM-dependent methyltransferase
VGLHSFRDPDGYVFESQGRIFRCVLPHAADDLRAFLGSSLAAQWMAEGKLVHTRILQNPFEVELPAECQGRLTTGTVMLEHTPIVFRNYPYEWTPEMLCSAATLTLESALAAMRAGFVLKDATPYNVMFDGAKPVFLDVLSFRRRDPLESIWQPYAQFMRTFVYPLMACRYFGLRLDEILLTHRDGLEPDRLLALCPSYRLLLPPFLSSVTIPFLLARGDRQGAADAYRVRHAHEAGEASFILERLFARAMRLLRRASTVRRRRTTTSQYMESGHPYAPGEFAEKERFVAAAFQRWSPKSVLDIGCNTGRFSLLAARTGAQVVAIDHDADAVSELWKSAGEANSDILPLVVDIGRPPGACGWQNSECTAFLDRARAGFECVLMLALIHHLLVNERVPLATILQLIAELTTGLAIVEYIDPGDSHFQRIARGRIALHRDVTPKAFEDAACLWFHILDSGEISPTRRIYVLQKKETETWRAAS